MPIRAPAPKAAASSPQRGEEEQVLLAALVSVLGVLWICALGVYALRLARRKHRNGAAWVVLTVVTSGLAILVLLTLPPLGYQPFAPKPSKNVPEP